MELAGVSKNMKTIPCTNSNMPPLLPQITSRVRRNQETMGILYLTGEMWDRIKVGKAPHKYVARYCQLKTEHGAIGTFLARIGAIETPGCWRCDARKQPVIHLLEFRYWRKERKTHQGTGKIQHQLAKQVGKLWLAVGSLSNFLKSTEIRCREGAVERELEWERKDKERENQFH